MRVREGTYAIIQSCDRGPVEACIRLAGSDVIAAAAVAVLATIELFERICSCSLRLADD